MDPPSWSVRSGSGRSPRARGLGLSISRRLVELHAGTIAAESGGDGQGATFTVVLPVPAHAAAPAAAAPVSGDRRLHGVRVLLVAAIAELAVAPASAN